MEQLKTVGIKKLKDSLSAYIREVKKGVILLVTDHGNIVAEMRTPVSEYGQIKIDALTQEWIDSNKLHLPLEKRKNLSKSLVSLPEGTAGRILDLERGK